MLLAAGLLFAVLGSAGSTGSTGAGYIATLSGGGGGAGGGWENGAFADGAGDKEVRNALVNKMPQIETTHFFPPGFERAAWLGGKSTPSPRLRRATDGEVVPPLTPKPPARAIPTQGGVAKNNHAFSKTKKSQRAQKIPGQPLPLTILSSPHTHSHSTPGSLQRPAGGFVLHGQGQHGALAGDGRRQRPHPARGALHRAARDGHSGGGAR